MIRIYADFNDTDQEGRVRLNTVGSLRDIENQRDLMAADTTVLLYMSGEFEVLGSVISDEGMWKGIPDWSTIRYYD